MDVGSLTRDGGWWTQGPLLGTQRDIPPPARLAPCCHTQVLPPTCPCTWLVLFPSSVQAPVGWGLSSLCLVLWESVPRLLLTCLKQGGAHTSSPGPVSGRGVLGGPPSRWLATGRCTDLVLNAQAALSGQSLFRGSRVKGQGRAAEAQRVLRPGAWPAGGLPGPHLVVCGSLVTDSGRVTQS